MGFRGAARLRRITVELAYRMLIAPRTDAGE
jgi:hypothetical protein